MPEYSGRACADEGGYLRPVAVVGAIGVRHSRCYDVISTGLMWRLKNGSSPFARGALFHPSQIVSTCLLFLLPVFLVVDDGEGEDPLVPVQK